MEPRLPEAPAEMITVTMGQGQRQGESLRTWFDRAVEAQFDYRESYNKLRYALLPRWHGSHEEILALGIECFRTGRYDTGVPYQLIESLESIRDDRGGDMSFWDQPEIYEMMRDVMVEYAARTKHRPDWRDWYLCYAAALANRNNHHEESRKFLEQVEGKVREDVYSRLGLLPKTSISESYLYSGPLGKRFTDAIELQKAGKHEQALAALEKLMADLPKDDKSMVAAKYQLAVSQMALTLASGEWLELRPGIDRQPWGSNVGRWTVTEKDELLGMSDASGMITLAGLKMPPRYEFSAQCEIKRFAPNQQPGAGLMLNFTGWNAPYGGVWVYPRDKKMCTRGREDQWHNVDCGNTFTLMVQVIDDRATVMLDGKQVAKFRGVGRPNAQRMMIGLSGMYETPDAEVVFREVKVRKLKEEAKEEEK